MSCQCKLRQRAIVDGAAALRRGDLAGAAAEKRRFLRSLREDLALARKVKWPGSRSKSTAPK
jgi:hypothetical protein